jgi:hypothetical protein
MLIVRRLRSAMLSVVFPGFVRPQQTSDVTQNVIQWLRYALASSASMAFLSVSPFCCVVESRCRADLHNSRDVDATALTGSEAILKTLARAVTIRHVRASHLTSLSTPRNSSNAIENRATYGTSTFE